MAILKNQVFTSESVTEGHPDKLCDRISDEILDANLAEDPNARVACECAASARDLKIFGEVTSEARINVLKFVGDILKKVGYTEDLYNPLVHVDIVRQSVDIAMGVDSAMESRWSKSKDLGAGDQGMMFGYACNETPELMPLSIALSHKLVKQLTAIRKNGTIDYLRPDGKAQITVNYNSNGIPKEIATVVLSAQHSPEVSTERLRADLAELVIHKVIPGHLLTKNTKFYINPTERFVIGGPPGDSGLTGRKIIVDTYGGHAPHGGGAFSGKDPTKVDRSVAYAARHIAKNIVAAELATHCEIQVAYAIGMAQPISITVNTFGSGKMDDSILAGFIKNNIDLRPAAIIERLDLRRPIYAQTATYGHFGRTDINLPWEQLNLLDLFKGLIASRPQPIPLLRPYASND